MGRSPALGRPRALDSARNLPKRGSDILFIPPDERSDAATVSERAAERETKKRNAMNYDSVRCKYAHALR